MLVLCPGQIGQFVGVGFCGWRKTGEPEKNPRSKTRTHIWHGAGVEPEPHCCGASALTTAQTNPIHPSLNLSRFMNAELM